MKASELMLFDWVLDTRTKKPLRVNPFMAEMEVPEWEPIPLTPEILKKNGFEFYDGGYRCEDLWIDGRNTYVHELQHLLKLSKIDKEITL